MIYPSVGRRSDHTTTSTAVDYRYYTDTSTACFGGAGCFIIYTVSSDTPVFIPLPKQSLPRQRKNKSPPANVPSGEMPGPPNNRPELDRVWNRQSS